MGDGRMLPEEGVHVEQDEVEQDEVWMRRGAVRGVYLVVPRLVEPARAELKDAPLCN